MKSVVPFVLVMGFLVLDASLAQREAFLGVCIRNCGQCKKMYGDFFMGQQCAETCLQTRGLSLPDCNNPKSLYRFLGKT